MAAESFDFIVVGAGPAGCVIAQQLANSARKPDVLLLEAGRDISSKQYRCAGVKVKSFQVPELNWGYKTQPQPYLNDRAIDYSRGLGLGGSSAINFGIWTVGSEADYNRWAKLVGDDTFRWEHAQKRYKQLENLHIDLPEEGRKYAGPRASDHGDNGKLNVSYSPRWERDIPEMIDNLIEFGWEANPDYNSGNPIGISPYASSEHKGLRTTAADILVDKPGNLKVVLQSSVQRVILEDGKAIGIESSERKYFATREVIVSAGALNSPHILMHSGLGPAAQLEKFNITSIKDIPAVGQHLRDHPAVTLAFARREGIMDRAAFYSNQDRLDAAMKQWEEDGTGEFSWLAREGAIGFLKSKRILESAELKTLPAEEQAFMQDSLVPQWEALTHFPAHDVVPALANIDYACFPVFLMNAQSRGEVTLQSSDPSVPLAMDPKLLTHPFDRMAFIQAIRELLEFTQSAMFAKDTVAPLSSPKSLSDEDIETYIKEQASTVWHMSGTVKMGKEGEPDAVVDSKFKVFGVDGLRVADMSVTPLLINGHTQVAAYIIGATCAEVLIKEYGLDKSA
ncbi:alcohol oxidase [Rhizodiscina lignyota]|uniref:Alcohol oxidase n=1 Tax=Rhizodiscina lignyota TaxID=1504668 RepID=A0A9P4M1A8_9PEZI|nr:alcohol oxidase [Rhizodiscina lignyota]